MRLNDFERRAGGFFSEFWKFAAKGNAIQLAVAVVLGGAFGAIVNSLVADIITPLISLGTNNANFNTLEYTIRPASSLGGTTTPPLVIGYGHLIQATLNFFVIGLSIFIIFKLFQGIIQRFQKKEAAEPPQPISTEEKLLCEIRDILKEQTNRVSDKSEEPA
jgi:large conductance mechanosensitive channel